MYIKLLEEAVLEEREIRGQPPRVYRGHTGGCRDPQAYIPDSGQRMDLYRRIALVRTDDDASDLIDELADRYGDIPERPRTHQDRHLEQLRLSSGSTEISQREDHLNLSTGKPDIRAISLLCSDKRYKGGCSSAREKAVYFASHHQGCGCAP